MVRGILFVSVFLIIFFISPSCVKNTDQSLGTASRIENRIIDSAGLLTEVQKQNLFKVIRNLEQNIGSQIAIVIVNTLEGEEITQFSIRAFEDLRLGREQQKDGILITVAYKDRKTRIEVGYGLEKIIKDEIAARIITEKMVPKFKEQKLYEGLYSAITKIKELIEENKKLVGQMP